MEILTIESIDRSIGKVEALKKAKAHFRARVRAHQNRHGHQPDNAKRHEYWQELVEPLPDEVENDFEMLSLYEHILNHGTGKFQLDAIKDMIIRGESCYVDEKGESDYMDALISELRRVRQWLAAKPVQTSTDANPVDTTAKAGQEKTMLRPTVKDISGIIKKLKALKKKQVAFVNAKYKVSDSDIDKLADRLDAARTSLLWQYAGSVEELIKKAAGFDVTLMEPPLIDEIISDRPTKTLVRAISALPMDELQKLLDKFLPELFQNTKTTADNKRHIHQIKNSISRELERKKKCKSDPAKLIEALRKYEPIRRKPKGYWPKAIQDLIDQIDMLLGPYLDYFKENGTSGKWGQVYIELFLKAGITPNLDDMIHELIKIRYRVKIEAEQSAPQKPAATGQETKTDEEPYSNYNSSPAITRHERCIEHSKNGVESEGSVLTMPVRSSKHNWEAIKSEYDISKRDFGKKINFVSDPFKRKIIFRDVEHAFVLASQGFSKSAVILAGGVIEELLRMYLKHKKIKPKDKRFGEYIKACEDNKLLKHGVSRLTDSIRDFRNLVHIEKEKEKRYTISKATAKGAVASIFTIANDFE